MRCGQAVTLMTTYRRLMLRSRTAYDPIDELAGSDFAVLGMTARRLKCIP